MLKLPKNYEINDKDMHLWVLSGIEVLKLPKQVFKDLEPVTKSSEPV